MRSTTTVATAVALLVLAGCADDPAPEVAAPEVEEPVAEAPDDQEEPDVDGEAPDATPAELAAEADAAIAHARADGGSDVEVVRAERVTWPDGALGCPDEDGMYTQALVEGYRIVLAVDGREVHFHGAEGEEPFRCDEPQPPVDG